MNIKANRILVFAAIIFSFACNNEQSVEKLKQEISGLKIKQLEINYQIDSLNKMIKNDTSPHDEIYRVPVEVKTITPEVFKHYFEASGNVEAINSAYVSPEMNGQIKSILVEEGDRVTKGQMLVKLNTAVLQKSIEELKTGLELASKIYEKQKELWDKNIGSEIEFLQAKNGKESLEGKLGTLNAQLELSQIRAPFNGIVDRIFQKVGEIASPGRQVIQLVNLTKLKIRADVSEDYLSRIKEGDDVEVTFPTYPNYHINTKIYKIGNIINPANRNFEIQLLISNKDEIFKPNMLAVVKINDFINEESMVVPSIIIKNDIQGEFVFVTKDVEGESVAQKVRVKTGESYKEKTIIKEGLKVNDKVIVEGYNMVTSGVNISVK